MTNVVDHIFDAILETSRRAEVARERTRLRADIARAETTCGSCAAWMTRRCPQEVHDNRRGRSSGPHMNASLCEKFTMSASALSTVEKWRADLSAIDRAKEKP